LTNRRSRGTLDCPAALHALHYIRQRTAKMSLLPQTRALLQFLRKNPAVRTRIAAGRNATVLYAGKLIQPAWMEILEIRRAHPEFATKKMLPEVLESIRLVGQPFPDLLLWAKSLDALQPWRYNGFIGWRALSGIFASNATGSVSFVVGRGVTRAEKVFAATEVGVLLRNPKVDDTTRDLLEYYQRCIKAGNSDLGVSFIGA
jgi:hypothetical protein